MEATSRSRHGAGFLHGKHCWPSPVSHTALKGRGRASPGRPRRPSSALSSGSRGLLAPSPPAGCRDATGPPGEDCATAAEPARTRRPSEQEPDAVAAPVCPWAVESGCLAGLGRPLQRPQPASSRSSTGAPGPHAPAGPDVCDSALLRSPSLSQAVQPHGSTTPCRRVCPHPKAGFALRLPSAGNRSIIYSWSPLLLPSSPTPRLPSARCSACT